MNSSEQRTEVDPDATPEREPMKPSDWIILVVLAVITGMWIVLLSAGGRLLLSLV